MREPEIIVDQRERNADLLSQLESMGAKVTVMTLAIGDYVISDRVCIERKTVTDFESSIISGRLFDQVKRLREAYAYPMLMLEGSKEEFRLHRKVLIGSIVALYVKHGITVITSESADETATILVSMARQEQDSEEHLPSLKGGARAYTSAQFQEFVIGNLPGIGPKLAKSMLVHFGTVRGIANATIEELMDVEKIGKRKAEVIYKILNEAYKKEA